MSDQSGGPGWWQASDGKWYPPESQSDAPTGGPPSSTNNQEVSWWKRRVPLWALILAGVVGVSLGAASASAPEDGGGERASASSATTTTEKLTTTTERTTATERPTTTTRPPAYTPVPTDFAIALITTEKQCFGSAGCIVSFTIDVSYVGTQLPDPAKTFTVVYDILGGEDPKTASFEVSGDEISYTKDDSISTASSDAVLTAVPTTVID